jgi:hypothetical protein
MAWNFDSAIIWHGRTMRVVVALDGRPLRFGDALACLRSESVFRDYLTGLLAAVPFTAFRWESPPVSQSMLTRPFEFVLIDAPYLEREPDPATFAKYFVANDGPSVVAIDNIAKTATLVVPRELGQRDAYAHFAGFLRSAPTAQIHALWQCLGEAAMRRLSTRPQWLSTAGAGVAWLHVRIDDTPKYYLHQPYTLTV